MDLLPSSPGISLLRCTLSDFEAVVTIEAHQPAYKTYVNLLPAYLRATYTQSRTSAIHPYYPIQYKASDPLVTSIRPDVSVSFPAIPPAETQDLIRSVGGREQTIKGTKVFIISTPENDFLRQMLRSGVIRTTPAATGTANIDSLASLTLVRRIFSSFFFTHTYPAFNDPGHLAIIEGHWDLLPGDGKRKAPEIGPEGSSKRSRVEVELDEDEDMRELEAETHLAAPPPNKVLYAVPSTEIRHAWGDVDNLPNGWGIFVRYVAETQNDLKEKIVPRVIGHYFLGALGSNTQEVRLAHEKIKSDFGILCATAAGKELAHIALCIDLGLQAQARIFPIVSEDQYIGCALMGCGFTIHAYGTGYSPVEPSSLRKNIELAGSHRSALQSIADVACGDDEEDKEAVLATKSMLQLKQIVEETNTTSEDREKIVALARRLRYGPRSWNVSPRNITEAFNLIADTAATLPTDLPIHPSRLFEGDRVSLIWSVFGDLAPTCHFVGGPVVDLTTTKNLPKHIAFRLIPLKDAVIDIQKIIADKKFCTTSLNRRSGPFKDRMYQNVDAVGILSAMIQACGISHGKGTGKERSSGTAGSSIFVDDF